MEFEQVLTRRVSARKYTGRMPSDDDIQKIIDAALLSPIVRWHKLHLSVVTNLDAMSVAEIAADDIFGRPDSPVKMPRPYLYNAPVWIILFRQKVR